MSKKFVNNVEEAVNDALRGLVGSSDQLQLHPLYCGGAKKEKESLWWPEEALDTSHTRQVRLPSRFDVFSSGYVGEGLLTAAVAGDVFASPPSRHIQQALQATQSEEGTILFITNYTGDRLNFGLAAERFQENGKNKVKTLLISDDVAIDSPSNCVGKRGLAGAVLTIKIAGAMSECGKSMSEIYEKCLEINENLGTLGVSLYPGAVPGKRRGSEIPEDEIEVGLGIHGEPGKHRKPYSKAGEIFEDILGTLQHKMQLKPKEELFVLLNNLGSVSNLEMNILTGELVKWCDARKLKILRLFVGSYMTSLDSHGVSVTFLKNFSNDLTEYLDAPTKAPGWSGHLAVHHPVCENRKEKQEKMETGNLDISKSGAMGDEHSIRECVKAVCAAMGREEENLNELDSAAGDGDCGTTFATASKAIFSSMDSLVCSHPQTLLQQIANIFEQTVGGTCGALYALMLNSASKAFDTKSNSESCAEALRLANDTLQKYGGARPGDRTMVDALDAAVGKLADGGNEINWEEAMKASEKAAEETAKQKATVGRASYTSEKSQKRPDAGAIAITKWLRAIHEVIHSTSNT
ncbi:unnamed protein product [Caenorhabditis auriculariae]|uniref:Triokinase/FMN cyclase n=1 Tax=Caenorhabditis auriculariae TaxID=2777116 RepID=A0A8S1GV71_9PELO|nr:unnamed protein product [Caenorhabditis auriculariae]